MDEVRPIVGVSMLRLGRNFDGGYVVPKLALIECDALISLGYGYDSSFEREFLKLNRKKSVNLYDSHVNLQSSIKRLFLDLLSVIFRGRGFPIFRSKQFLEYLFNFDDSLDVVGVHLVGGLWGCLSLGFFGSSAINSLGLDGLFYGGGATLLGKQAFGAFFVLAYSFIVTLIIGFAIDKTMGLRVKEEAEVSGIDYDQHAETGYELTTSSRGGFSS